MRNRYMLIGVVGVVVGVLLSSVVCVLAGTPDSPGAPGATNSFTLNDIYNRLDTGAEGAQSTFTEPAVAPGVGTMHTLSETMGIAPAKDDANGAATGDVADGKTFWGLTAGEWGKRTGTAAAGAVCTGDATAGDVFTDKTFSNATATGLAGTLDLACNDPTSFDGTANLVANAYDGSGGGNNRWCMTDSGDAVEGDILSGKKAWVDGSVVTGTIATRTVSNTTVSQLAGYYDAFNLSTVDTDLASGNVVSDTVIFGVTGSAIEATGNAIAGEVLTGKTFSNASAAGIAGAMPDKDGNNASTGQSRLGSTNYFTAPTGYYDSDDTVSATDAEVAALDADITAGNIVSDTVIFGVTGTAATATDPAPVPKTGQTTCYATDGDPRECAGTGEDGELQKGVAWPSTRFITSTTGIVTDTLTGLIWLKNANCYGTRSWANALSDANTLDSGECSLTDGSIEGDWRLPNVRELYSLIDSSQPTGGAPVALPSGHPFDDVKTDLYYGASTTRAYNTTYAWYVYLYFGYVSSDPKTFTYYVWPVRGGQ